MADDASPLRRESIKSSGKSPTCPFPNPTLRALLANRFLGLFFVFCFALDLGRLLQVMRLHLSACFGLISKLLLEALLGAILLFLNARHFGAQCCLFNWVDVMQLV